MARDKKTSATSMGQQPNATVPGKDRTDRLDQLGVTFEALKRSFARYFEGLERTAPLEARDKFKSEVVQLQRSLGNNTGLLFRYNTFKASILSQETLWNRILAQIEAGTYPPHKARAKTIGAADRAASKIPAAAGAPAPHPLARLHAAYTAFAIQAGQKPPSLEALAVVVAHKVAEARQQSKGRGVDVRVVLENNVPVLQVTPKP